MNTRAKQSLEPGVRRQQTLPAPSFIPASSTSTRARNQPPRGFSLFEMLLVMAIIAAAAAIAVPSIGWLQRRQRLEQGAEYVRAKMSSARVRAVDTGMPYQVRFEPGGRRFAVLPVDLAVLAQAADSNGTVRVFRAVGMLAQGATFEGGDALTGSGNPLPDDWFSGLPDAASYTGANWSAAVLFFPDGSATNAEFTIRDEAKRAMRISVRALTGAVTVAPVEGG